jgi:pimeloyl-ACP methyl ester carboxylesterase
MSLFPRIKEMLLGGGFSKPDPTKPLATAWYYAKAAEQGQRLFIFLPGRRDRASDFVRHGFVAMAQCRVPGLDCVAVDATICYYFDGSIADRLHREIVRPARTLPYHEIWLVGVSMGGLGAFFHERMHPGEITGFILLAPFVGEDRKLFKEIDAAGGAEAWAAAQPAARCREIRTLTKGISGISWAGYHAVWSLGPRYGLPTEITIGCSRESSG